MFEDFYTENYETFLKKLKIYKLKDIPYVWVKRFPGSSVINNLSANTGAGSILESGRSPRGENGSPLQSSCLGNPWRQEPSGLQCMGVTKEPDMT